MKDIMKAIRNCNLIHELSGGTDIAGADIALLEGNPGADVCVTAKYPKLVVARGKAYVPCAL